MRGIAQFNLYQYEQAIKFFEKGLVKFPQHAMMISLRGNAHFKIGNYKDAEADYTQSLSLKNNFLPEIKQSWAYKDEDAVQQDLAVLNLLLDIYGHRAEARINLENFAGAKADVEEVLRLPAVVSGLDYAYVLSGILGIIEGNNSAALSSFNKAIAINANNAVAYANRAIVKMNLAFKTKVVYYSFALGNGVNGRFNFPNVAKSSINTDNLEAAITDCNKAIQINKDYAYFIRANIKLFLDQPDYWYDLLKAEQLGFTEATALITEKKWR